MVLGQASVLLGVMMTCGWILALALVIPPKEFGWSSGPRMLLPIEPPLIGMAIGVVALVTARLSRERVSGFAVAGLALNALPLAMALILVLLRSLH